MFARTQNVPQEDVDSIVLAAELEDEQHRDAQGEVLETAPSSSSGLPGPVIITTTKLHPPKGDESLKSSSQKGKSSGKNGTADKKMSIKPVLLPEQNKLAKGTKIPKHKETDKPNKPGLTRTSPLRLR